MTSDGTADSTDGAAETRTTTSGTIEAMREVDAMLPMTPPIAPVETKPDPTQVLSELSRRCTERMLKIIDVDTGRTLEKLGKTTSLGDGKARAMGVDIGFKLDTEAVEKLDRMADVVLKLEQARAAARKSDDEIERLVIERMRKAVAEAGGGSE